MTHVPGTTVSSDESEIDEIPLAQPQTTGPRPQESAAAKGNLMRRTMINFWLDTLMLVNFVALIWVSTVVRFVFPPAVTADHWTLWGWNVDQWIGVQYATLCVFVLLVVLHLMLHWTWVCGIIAARYLPRRDGKKANVDDGVRTLWGVGLLIICLNIMGIAIAAAVLSIKGSI